MYEEHSQQRLATSQEAQQVGAQCQHKYFDKTTQQTRPLEMTSQHPVAWGCFLKEKSPKNADISLLPSLLKVLGSGSPCPLVISEEEKSSGKIENKFTHRAAGLPIYTPDFK